MVVLGNNAARLGNGGAGVVGEAGIDFSGDAAGNDGQDLPAEGDGQALKGELGDVRIGGAVAELLAGVKEDAVDDGLILRQLGGGGDERRVGGGVLGTKLLHGFDVAGVGDDHGVTAQLFEQILRHDSSWGRALRAGARSAPVYCYLDSSGRSRLHAGRLEVNRRPVRRCWRGRRGRGWTLRRGRRRPAGQRRQGFR